MSRTGQREDSPNLAGWFAVAVFLAAYAVSFLDRQILSLIVEPLKHDLGISDTQIGIVQGPAFGLFYATLGLPLGWLADRVHRVRLIAAAIALWSVMTMLCGFATDFTGLLVARFGVGVGEAALVPAAVSLLADLFRPARRALPVSVFTCGLSLGGGLALTLGGAFIAFSETGAAQLPLAGAWLAARAPWQNVFLLAGLAGLPVAALVLLVIEPRQGVRNVSDPLHSIRAAWEHLRAARRFFVPMLASMAGFFVLTTALSAWLPSLFVRQHGWSPADAGRTLGTAILICGLCGNLASGVLSNALARRGRRDATLLTMLGGAWVMTPAAIVMALLPAAEPALLATALLYCLDRADLRHRHGRVRRSHAAAAAGPGRGALPAGRQPGRPRARPGQRRRAARLGDSLAGERRPLARAGLHARRSALALAAVAGAHRICHCSRKGAGIAAGSGCGDPQRGRRHRRAMVSGVDRCRTATSAAPRLADDARTGSSAPGRRGQRRGA